MQKTKGLFSSSIVRTALSLLKLTFFLAALALIIVHSVYKEQLEHLYNVVTYKNCKLVAGDRVVSTLDCYTISFPFESSILPLLKHAGGEEPLDAILIIKIWQVLSEVNFEGFTPRMSPPSQNKTSLSGFETQRSHRRKNKTGASLPIKKDIVSYKN